MNGNEVVRVIDKVSEGRGITTLRFELDRTVRPGQFFMVWVPGVDEVPMSASYIGKLKGITVREVGEATKALSSVKVGEMIGIRGPYGRGFMQPAGRYLVVGGGTGIAAVLPAIEMSKDRSIVDVALGARTSSELIFEERARKASDHVMVSTDDGSKGHHGTVVSLVDEMLSKRSYSQLIACGPEKMLFYLLEVCKKHGVESQMSLERFMKCGSGLCGSCVIDGRRVCADGPVFLGREIDEMKEFGRSKRDEAGRSVPL
ncbi:MAG: dihydroorotate dehydrogenase electron transfer subunit [Methanomassiliicoccales archaeon]|nr:MAG: dihydroorotate dehydrogenase electron transfer subunit [Methanomassiliicoccales archaeon]